MHNELVSYIQSNHAADGVEVRAVGPKAVTLALPPELHDLGNICGELEVRFNARIDMKAAETPGVGPTATVWVLQDQAQPAPKDTDNNGYESDTSQVQPNDDSTEPQVALPAPKAGWFSGLKPKCSCNFSTAALAGLTVLAATFSIANNGAALWKHLEL